jgi:hypothetical protein
MNELHCQYQGDRDRALIAFLYDDPAGDRAERAQFEAHVAACTQCSDELAALRGVRVQLGRWAPPEPTFVVGGRQPSAVGPRSVADAPSVNRNPQSSWWREIPAWAQVAAALLFLGVSAGLANLDVKYDANGLSVRTGWVKPAPAVAAVAPAPAATPDPAPWRADLASLERQMKTELRAVQVAASAPPTQIQRVSAPADAETVRRIRALIEESEKRQQSELALRVAEVLRDVHAQRQADLIKIDRTLGAVENRVGVEVMKDRQRLNTLLVRTSGRQ